MKTLNEFEICRDYRQAKNKNEQIKIMADLNACKPDDIIDVLKRGGLIPGLPRVQAKPPMKQKKPGSRIDWSIMDSEVEKLAREGLKVSEIAERLGITAQNIYDRRSALRKEAKRLIGAPVKSSPKSRSESQCGTAETGECREGVAASERSASLPSGGEADTRKTVDGNAILRAVEILQEGGFAVDSASFDIIGNFFVISGKVTGVKG